MTGKQLNVRSAAFCHCVSPFSCLNFPGMAKIKKTVLSVKNPKVFKSNIMKGVIKIEDGGQQNASVDEKFCWGIQVVNKNR